MKIKNQNIYGGNQQYADIIINGSDHLSETDRQLIELIYKHTESEADRKALLANLETIRSTDAKEEDKKKAKSLWKQFRDSMVTESGKQIVKELIEGGFEGLL